MQQVQTALLPFHLHRKTVSVPHGLSLQQMVDHLIPNAARVTDSKAVDVVITINDEVVPYILWRNIRPKAHAIVGINVVPAKGKGKKNPLATILSIAVMVAAPYVAGWATAGILSATGVTSLAGAQAIYGAVRIGISLVGYLATSMLSSTPSQGRNSPTTQSSTSESPTQFIEGSSNQILKYGIVPLNLGTNRMFPPQAALPYSESVGNKQFVRQLFTYGFGEHVVADKRIGETAIDQYQGISMEDRLSGNLNSGTTIYTNDIYQEGLSVTLTNAAGYIVQTTQQNTDEAQLDLTYANGLMQFDQFGNKVIAITEYEITYSPHGLNQWTTGESGKTFGASSVAIPVPTLPPENYNNQVGMAGMRNDAGIIVLNIANGALTAMPYTQSVGDVPTIPNGCIRIASYTAKTTAAAPTVATILTLTDDRASSIPNPISVNTSFIPTFLGGTVNVSAGTFAAQLVEYRNSTTQAVRVTYPIKFPSRGQWDVRIKRTTIDQVSDRFRDVATLTALRSITYTQPVLQADISGTAMRIQATDQLNGSVDRYNAIVSTLALEYFPTQDAWIKATTSNPAALYRYVLQCKAFIKRLPDNRINIDKLEEWHQYCVRENLTYNRVIDYATSIEDVLRDIAAAGMATPHYVDGIYSVIIDNERPDIKGMVTPRNSWGYIGNINYPEIPHALRVEFRNTDKGYNVDERIVFAPGYTALNAVEYERLEFLSCTNSDLAWYYGQRYFATALTQPETHRWNMDFENLTFNRGDRITFVNDVILVGVGSGRIKSLTYKPGDATKVIGFTLDDTVGIPSVAQFGVRIRHADASGYVYYALTTVEGNTTSFTFKTEITAASAPGLGSLCSFTEFGKELDLIVIEIQSNADQSAKITAIDYAPQRFDSTEGSIPPFSSNVTVPLELLPPLAPLLAGPVQSDETVMTRNSDGSYTGRMVIPLENRNEPSVTTMVTIKRSGATDTESPDILLASPNSLILTGLQDAAQYDIEIRYQRQGGRSLMSQPLVLNGQKYIGASTLPANVADFMYSAINELGMFQWTPNADIDLSHYVIKFSRLLSGATWANSQILADNIQNSRATLPMQAGTYLIKAVDILGNESADAVTIVSFDGGALKNVVEFLQEQTTFLGTKDNCHVVGGDLYLTDPTLPGIYYFNNTVDLGDVFTSYLSSALQAYGSNYLRIRSIAHIRSLASVRGAGVRIRNSSSIRAMPSIRGISPTDWSVKLQMRTSNDAVTWGAWRDFVVGNQTFRRIQFRLLMNSFNPNVSPRVDILEVTVDMPDRVEFGEDLTCPPSGYNVVYDAAFINNPAVNITLQNGAVDDRLEYVIKDNEQFTIKIYNATLATYVTRSFDFTASGYGRIIT